LCGIGAATRANLYAAKLVGQAVGAAGLSVQFDALGSLGRGLALTSSDKTLAALQAHLAYVVEKNGLRLSTITPPHLTLIKSGRRQPLQVITPLAVKISGLALLRAEDARGEFQVLRRWPLNTPSRLVFSPTAPLQSPLKPKQKKPRAMAITVYGIKNCDTMKKAFTWLEAHGVAYEFHDYKKLGVTKTKLAEWCKALGWEKVLNRAGPSFRKLPDEDKEGLNQAKAISLMMSNPSMIKRPLLDTGKALELGFKPERYDEIFRAK
jgi:Spx/MgsR family transcriptional regulator